VIRSEVLSGFIYTPYTIRCIDATLSPSRPLDYESAVAIDAGAKGNGQDHPSA
jgi:hypothetical protein